MLPIDAFARALNDADSTKKKLQFEPQDRQIEESENAIGAFQNNKISLTSDHPAGGHHEAGRW